MTATATGHRPTTDPGLRAAAEHALALVTDGARLGLGTGHAAAAFVDALGARVQRGLRVTGVPTSSATARRARELGIALVELDADVVLDLTVDGADEVSPALDLVKGRGGALVRERIVAAASRRQVIVVGPEKLVPALGSRGPLPIEVVPFGLGPVLREVTRLGLAAVVRQAVPEAPFTTDNGNRVLDCTLREPLADRAAARALAGTLRAIPGVVDTGLFIGTAERVLVGHPDGSVDEFHTGNVRVLENPRALTDAAAEAFVTAADEAIRSTGRFAVALSGGSTPASLYALLASPPYAARVDWARVHVFFGDERCVPPDDPASNYRMARERLLDHVPIPASQVHRIRGEDDPMEAAAAYERELRTELATPTGPPRQASGACFDLVFLGLGPDGHTASLFPGTPAVHERERWVIAHRVAGAPAAPWRITFTPPVIETAADVVFLVEGAQKAATLRRVLEGPSEPDILPAQAIARATAHVRWLVDAGAAGELRRS